MCHFPPVGERAKRASPNPVGERAKRASPDPVGERAKRASPDSPYVEFGGCQAALFFAPRDSLTLRCRPPTPLVVSESE